jgi:glutamate-1-semialdehyde 2,1-aminomutase
LPTPRRFVIARGKGSRLWDVDGREYIDYVMGAGPQILGHGHPAVLEAVRQQLELGTQFYWLTEPAIRLATKIATAVPCGGPVRFAGTGNEATFMALRLARAYTGRERVLKFEGGYHGTHDYALMSFKPGVLRPYPEPVPDSAGIPQAIRELVLSAPFNDSETASSIIHRYCQSLAAVIVEPLFRGIPPRSGFLESLRQATQECGIVLIFDEVVTGFRIAWGGGQELYGVTPDLATYGKTIGGGLPISAIAGRPEIMLQLDPGRRPQGTLVVSGGTFSGNPVSTAAGLAALGELVRPGVYQHLWALGKRLADGLRTLASRCGEPVVVQAIGPIVELYFTTQTEIADYRQRQAVDTDKRQRFDDELLSRGVFVNPGGAFYLSLAHSDVDVDETLEHCDRAMQAVASTTLR